MENKENNVRFKTKSEMVRFFLKGSTRLFLLSVVISFCVTFLELIGPKIVQYAIDFCISGAAGDAGSIPGYLRSFMDYLGGSEYLRSHLYLIAIVIDCSLFCSDRNTTLVLLIARVHNESLTHLGLILAESVTLF